MYNNRTVSSGDENAPKVKSSSGNKSSPPRLRTKAKSRVITTSKPNKPGTRFTSESRFKKKSPLVVARR